jgi:hypothetical protein
MTYLPSYVRQNMAVTVGHVPRSGERSCKGMNHSGEHSANFWMAAPSFQERLAASAEVGIAGAGASLTLFGSTIESLP